MKVWIDLSNSPHPLFFEPLVADLRAAGHEPLLTARDHAQTVELARERFPGVEVVGGASGSGSGPLGGKGASLVGRTRELVRWIRRTRPDVALSHNSYAQISAARAMRVPAVTGMDFEYQPANHLAFRLAQRVLVPDALPTDVLRRQGARPRKLIRFAGFKEEVYLGEIEPDPGVLESAGLGDVAGDGEREAIVLTRSAPAGAAYHRGENPLFERCIRALSSQPGVRTIVLARHAAQRDALLELGLPRVVVPEHAVDARSLLHRSDLFIGAGGTMSREAALLGVPTFSMFAGRRPAVDEALIRAGRMRMLTDPAELPEVQPREPGSHEATLAALRESGARIRRRFVDAVLEIGPS